ncbi:Zn-ribbon domain-containing OB-fold protein [Rhodococcus qingshengii]|uniref:Zn-ribbon domain-containing OB-fold protein n=1 Tax=Rhodococcus qingshengii TaxID=334542 RepID=UPI00145614E8|nr:OB-fold domain-containing protein [Rhodococcus qingshengii]
MSLLPLRRDTWSAEFFDAAGRGQLMLLRCADCHEWSAPQARRCAYCFSDRVVWTAVSGRGAIVTWTMPHVRDGESTKPSYVVALVQLDEGPWIYAQGAAGLELVVGQVVTIEFAPVDGGELLPVLAVPE